MSYMKRYFEEVLAYLMEHPEKTIIGTEITITADTFEGKKEIKHVVIESDLEFLAEWESEIKEEIRVS